MRNSNFMHTSNVFAAETKSVIINDMKVMKQEKFKLTLEPNNNDVLCGRGSITYLHPGNKQFRSIVSRNKKYYNQSENGIKTIIARSIVSFIRNRSPPGRFLAQTKETKKWSEITFDAAVQKTQQALREKSKWTKSDSKLSKETLDEKSDDMRNEDLDPLYSQRFATNPESRKKTLYEEEKQDLHSCGSSQILDMLRISPREDYIDELIVDLFHKASGTDTGSNQYGKTNIPNVVHQKKRAKHLLESSHIKTIHDCFAEKKVLNNNLESPRV